MSNFIKDYIIRMRSSDEKTKHRSALTISIVASVIMLSIVFIFIKDSFLNISTNDKVENVEATANDKNNVISPISSFSRFLKDSGKRFGELRSTFGEMSSAVKQVNNIGNLAEENIATASIEFSTSTDLHSLESTSSNSQ